MVGVKCEQTPYLWTWVRISIFLSCQWTKTSWWNNGIVVRLFLNADPTTYHPQLEILLPKTYRCVFSSCTWELALLLSLECPPFGPNHLLSSDEIVITILNMQSIKSHNKGGRDCQGGLQVYLYIKSSVASSLAPWRFVLCRCYPAMDVLVGSCSMLWSWQWGQRMVKTMLGSERSEIATIIFDKTVILVRIYKWLRKAYCYHIVLYRYST